MNILIHSPRLQKRILSALLIIPVVVWMILAGGIPFIILVAGCASVCFYEWFRLSLKTQNKALFIVLGLFYIGITFWCCYLIRVDYSVKAGLIYIIMIWASDIGAYATGKTIGGPKMAVSVSPNKTWAGFAGAIIFPGLAASIFMLIDEFLYNQSLTLGIAIGVILCMMIIGAVIGAVGQAGDLLISWFKRHVQVKDTGDLIPGHGGLLDRVDALMLSAPVFLFFLSKFSYVFEI